MCNENEKKRKENRTEKYEENYLTAMNTDDEDNGTALKRCCYWYLWLHNGRDAFDTDLPNMSATPRIYYTKNWFIRKFITL